MPADSPVADLASAHSSELRLRRSSTAEQAADVLRGLIIRGEIESGSQLTESPLAAALGISRNTMRETLRILTRDGLLTSDHHRSASVISIDVPGLVDIFAARRVIE